MHLVFGLVVYAVFLDELGKTNGKPTILKIYNFNYPENSLVHIRTARQTEDALEDCVATCKAVKPKMKLASIEEMCFKSIENLEINPCIDQTAGPPSLPNHSTSALSVAEFIAAESFGINDDMKTTTVDFDLLSSSGKYEGDIDLRGKPIEYYVDKVIDESPDAAEQPSGVDVVSSATKGHYYRWENAVIPYSIEGSFNKNDRIVIANAISEFSEKTCIKWVPRTSQEDYVSFVKDNGCYSYVGRADVKQPLSLGADCVTFGIVVHEMMHAAGFHHEHSRPDRDHFVDILYQNINREDYRNFRKLSLSEIEDLGTPYDYQSIMHYSKRLYSNNGLITIKTKTDAQIGQTLGLSKLDVEDLNKLYKCSPPGPEPRRCMDKHTHCEYWAQRGGCVRNLVYMQKNCKQSCWMDGCRSAKKPCYINC